MKRPIYLDNNATTPVDPRVADAMNQVIREHFGNPASSTHSFGWYAEELVNIAREKVAACINSTPEEIIFTSGATESINLALKGICFRNFKQHSKMLDLIYPAIEHKATLDTAAAMDEVVVRSKILKVNPQGRIDDSHLVSLLKDSATPFVSFSIANNEIGSIQDVESLIKVTKETNPNVLIHLDATQAVGKLSVDCKKLGADLLSFSAHKIYGPKGVGALFIRKGLISKLEPLIHGGGHEQGLRAGTLNVAAIVGFGKACELVLAEGDIDSRKLRSLSGLFFNKLESRFELTLNGPAISERLAGNLNLQVRGVSNTELIGKLTSKVAFSVSSACTSKSKTPSHVLEAIGLSNDEQRQSFRLGFGRFSTEEETVLAAKFFSDAIAELIS